ncbi:MAG: hypothetical protein J1F63_07000 [Oscillospiraceae bacterium]|nr:hypothetical protein [Oscillospiraceae bacterium]
MKKYTSLILALILALSLLPGCTPADIELWAAMRRTGEAENYTLSSSMSWDVTVHEPIRTEYNYEGYLVLTNIAGMGGIDGRYNDILNILDLLAEDMTLDTTTVKNGGDMRVDMRFSKPDLRLFFSFWRQMKDENAARYIFKIPSMFITSATRGKDYIVLEGTAQTDNAQNENVHTSAGYIESLNRLNEYISKNLSSLAKEAEVTGNGNVYTVRIDAAALRRIADEVIDAITSEEGAALAVDLYTKYTENTVRKLAAVSGESAEELLAEMPTAEEARAIYDEAMKDAKLYAAVIGEQLEKSGLLKNGVTLKYTVNSDGLIEKVESEIVLDVDLEALSAAFAEIIAIIEGTGADTYTNPYTVKKGSFTVTFKTTSVYDYSAAEVVTPEITEQNSVDIMAELTEYQEYTNAKYEWNTKWNSYLPYYVKSEFLENNPQGSVLTVKNLSNGKEAEMTPLIKEGEVYLPVSELVNLLDGASVTWNPMTMAVELQVMNDCGTPSCYIILNADGELMSDEYFHAQRDEWGNYIGEILSQEQYAAFRDMYNREDSWSTSFNSPLYSYFDENGKSYIRIEFITNILSNHANVYDSRNYLVNLEGNVLSLDYKDNVPEFEYDGSIEDNFFYKLEDIWEF